MLPVALLFMGIAAGLPPGRGDVLGILDNVVVDVAEISVGGSDFSC